VAALALAAWALAGVVRADAIDVRLHPREVFGKGVPRLEVRILEPIAGYELRLQRSDGRKLQVKGGGPPGVMREVRLDQPEGKFGWEGVVIVRFPNGGEGELPLRFESELLGPLRMTFRKEELDLRSRRAVISLSRPAAKASVQVQMDTGAVVNREVQLHGEPAGTPIVLEWPEAAGEVMTISIKATDTSDFYTGVELSPWQVSIPHEEVVFDSGQADVRKDQQARLDAAFEKLAEVVGKYGKLAPLSLYIAGHTDTAGDAAANRGLSQKRARSIGAYLRKRGARLPIFYEGFGEEWLAVPTPDETPEERNRRAEYIVAIEDPVPKNPPFPPKWRKLTP